MADWLIVKWNRQKPPFFVGFMGRSVRAVADDRLNVEMLLRRAWPIRANRCQIARLSGRCLRWCDRTFFPADFLIMREKFRLADIDEVSG